MNFPKNEMKKIVNEEKKKTTDKLVEFCAADVRAFQTITGKGFINLAQHFVSVGARRGDIDVATIIPHPTTVSRSVSKMKTKKLQDVFPVIQKAIENNECAGTTDGWTDDHKKNKYLSMTVHFFDDDFVLHKKDLFCTLFKEIKKSGLKMRRAIRRKFYNLGFATRFLHTMPFVTDRGSDVVRAFKGRYIRKNCYCHVINTILSNTFEHHTPIHVDVFISDCKSIITYLKQSCKANQATYTPKQEVSTRWNSRLRMINSIIQQPTEIMAILTEAQRQKWSINVDLGNELVRFLTPFKEATDTLEAEKYPTANLILLCRVELKKDLTEGNFVGPIKTLAKFALKYLDMKWPILMEHKTACFLDPRYRYLNMLTEVERNGVFEEILNLMKEIPGAENVGPSPPKKRRFSLYEERIDDEDENEIQLYLQTADYSKTKRKKHLVESFWKDNKLKFPKLYSLARKILCVPAASASSERMFCYAKKTVDRLRSNIKPKRLDDLMFLRDKFTKVSGFSIYSSCYKTKVFGKKQWCSF